MSENSNSFTPTPYDPSAPAHFTPTQGNYRELKPFRFWCQKVLPLVYDDSLSYYELLCKVVDYLNKTMEDVDTLHTDVDNLHTAYEELQADYNTKYAGMTAWINQSYQALVDFINTYFEELDVQEEINNKLDDMAEDGTLTNLISAYVDPIYGAYESRINSEVSTQNDKIAVLEGRMDEFASLPDGSTTGDAELADIRVEYNGKIASSAGNAVREQITDVINKVDNDLSNNTIHITSNWLSHGVEGANGHETSTNTTRKTLYIDNDIYQINTTETYKVSLFAYNENNEYIGCYNGSGYGTTITWFDKIDVPYSDKYRYKIVIKKSDNTDIDSGFENNISFVRSRYINNDNLSHKLFINNANTGWELGGIGYEEGVFVNTTTRARKKLNELVKDIKSNNITLIQAFAYTKDGEYVGAWNGTIYQKLTNNWGNNIHLPDNDYVHYIVIRNNTSADITDEYTMCVEYYPVYATVDLVNDTKNNIEEYVNNNLAETNNYTSNQWIDHGIAYSSGNEQLATTRKLHYLDSKVKSIKSTNNYEISLFAYDDTMTYIGCWNGIKYVDSNITWFTELEIPNNSNYHYKLVIRLNDNSDIPSGFEEYIVFCNNKFIKKQDIDKKLFVNNNTSGWELGGISYDNGAFTEATTRARKKLDPNVRDLYANNYVYIQAYAYTKEGVYIGVWNGSVYQKTQNSYGAYIHLPDNDYIHYIAIREYDTSADITDDDYKQVLELYSEYVSYDFLGNKDNLITPTYNTIIEGINGAYNKMYKKKMTSIGDSITYGFIPRNYSGYPGQLRSFAQVTADKLKMDFVNQGITGSTVAIVSGRHPMCQRYQNLPDDADIITVMGGTNDIRNGVQLGTFSDETGETYYGALKILLGGLYKKYFIDQGVTIGQKKKIIVCTPPKLLLSSASEIGGTGILRDMTDWIKAIKEVAEYYSFPVLDFYNLSGINPHLNETVQGYETGYTGFYNPYITDGTHPTQEGANMMADMLIGFLNNL